MLGRLLNTTVEARARRAVLIAKAAEQRQRMGVYLDAFDPVSRWLERAITAVRYILARPVIPAGVLAALILLKPRRVVKIAVFAWKAKSWIRRIRSAFP